MEKGRSGTARGQRCFGKKVEATLIESGCTYGEARRVLDELSYRYRKKSGNLVEALNISEIAKETL